MNELINIEAKNTLTSLEVAEITGKDHKSILRDIRDEIDKLGEERGRLIFVPTEYTDNFNRKQPAFLLNYKGVLQLGARYNAETRFKLIEKIEQLQKPMTIEDMIILQANEMKSVKHRIDIVENKVDNEIRIDHTEQRKLQKAVSIRVYQRLDVIDADRNLMFPAIERIKEKILCNTEMNNRHIESARLNANLFKGIKFIKKRKAKKKWLTQKSQIKK